MKNRNLTLYEKLANEVEKQVQTGVLQAGEKIASVRRLSEQYKVSVNTVLQAYVLLEKRGIIEARPQSGFYVSPPHSNLEVRRGSEAASKPLPVQIPELVTSVFEAAQDRKYVQLGAAILSPDLYPNEALARITRSVLRDQIDVNSFYEFTPGAEAYRKQIAKRFSKAGAKVAANDVIATNGAQEALFLSLRVLTNPGDTVLIESPNYFGVLQAVNVLGLKVIEVPAHARTGVDPDDVRNSLKRHKVQAALLMPNFNNPLGSLSSDESKQEFVRICQSHGVPIIEDDVYGDLSFQGQRPKLLRAFENDGSIVTVSSFSKCLSPGSRCGWAMPGKYMADFKRLQSSSTIGANRIQQHVIAEYLASGGYDRHLRRLRTILHTQVQKTTQAVFRSFPAGTRVSQPQGGFMVWVELPEEVDSVKLHQAAIEKKIGIAPGVIFSPSGKYRNYIRLNCGRIWCAEIEKAIQTLGDLAQKQMTGK